MDARERARENLLQTFVDLGFPEEFGVAVADGLRGEKSMMRMARYLRGARPDNMEEIADEMLAIIAERDSWVEKKVSERANGKITQFYNRDRTEDDD